jgi:hypothetical protein
MYNCANCGGEIADLFNFCPYCGEMSIEGFKRREKARIAYESERQNDQANRARVLEDTLLTLRRKYEREVAMQTKAFHVQTKLAERKWQERNRLINCSQIFILPELPPCDHKDCNREAEYSVINPHDHPVDKSFYCEQHALDLLLGSIAIGDDTAARTMTRLVKGLEL